MAEAEGYVFIPWRSNRLSMLLKVTTLIFHRSLSPDRCSLTFPLLQPLLDVESRQPSRTVIIAHVSPHIQDATHSANTLSYAAPFRTGPPKLTGPGRYDPKDPRTWTHNQTRTWLQAEFTKKVKGVDKLEEPLNPENPVGLPVDLNIFCPAGTTALTYARMTTMDIVERCLLARVDADVEVVSQMAMDAAGRLFYLVMTAKARTRKAIMHSRKGLDEKAGGEAGMTFPKSGARRAAKVPGKFGKKIIDAVASFGEAGEKEVEKAVAKAEERGGGDVVQAEIDAINRLIAIYIREISRPESVELAAN